jgi:ElaB/YqjD/DUF883 family membrane-anchored ribosome-binding protein
MKTREISEKLGDWQKRASETARNLGETAKNLGETTDRYVHENTWTSIACAALLGCIVGFMLGRGRD